MNGQCVLIARSIYPNCEPPNYVPTADGKRIVTESNMIGAGRAIPFAGKLCQPKVVEGGEIVDVDTGMPGSVVLTVRRDEETYYETYELVSVEPKDELAH